MYSYEDALQASLEYFDGDDLAAKVFVDKYALCNNKQELLEQTPTDMHWRIANEFARIEATKFSQPYSAQEIFDLLDHFRYIVPQGSPMYGIGNKEQYVTLSNCYLLDSPIDSYGGICHVDEQLVQLSKRRGGTGISLDNLRPVNTPTKNSSKTSTGLVSWMTRYSNSIREVGQAGRRGALMLCVSVHHPQVLDFVTAKQNNTSVTGANISVKLTDEFLEAASEDKEYEQRWPVDAEKPKIVEWVNAREIWNKIIENAHAHAEPGLLFWDNIIRESPADCYAENNFRTHGTNPCSVYETKVYVADGRGMVSIGDLAKQKKDVKVFCLDDKHKICIRTMRHPRKTGAKQKIYKVTLDDGSFVRCTANHKLLKKNGEYCEIKNLQPGDSLDIITRFEASIKDIFPKANSNSQDYYWLDYGIKTKKSEHRLIAEHYYGKIPCKNVVHHKDYNSQNNCPDNLEVMSKTHHDEIHSVNMIGDKNPMRRALKEWSVDKWNTYRERMSLATSGYKNGRYIDVTNKELIEHAIQLTKKLGRRFSTRDWKDYADKHKLPITISKYRQKELGTLKNLSNLACQYLSLECNVGVDTRVLQTNIDMMSQGYTTQIKNNRVYVEKSCEYCHKTFYVEHCRRETALCSQSCVNQFDSNRYIKSSTTRTKHEEHQKEIKGKQQIENFLNLKYQLKRNPKQKEWEQECKNNNTQYRIGKHSAFKKYSDLKQASYNYNHKVVSIKFDGYEDVYNGTVDEYHNFLIGGFESINDNNKKQWHYIVNLQCGEIPLSALDSCRLLLLNLLSYVNNPFTNKAYFDYKKFYVDVKIAQRLMDDMIDLELECIQRIIDKIDRDPEPIEVKSRERDIWIRIKQNCYDGRRTGLGTTALGDTIAALGFKYGSNRCLQEVDEIYKTLKFGSYMSSAEMAEELGCFPIWDWEKEKKCPFLKRFSKESLTIGVDGKDILAKIKKYGRRNIANLTIAPAGSVSIETQTTSGCEPLIWFDCTRRKKVNPNDEGVRVDFVDETGDSWQHFKVLHPTVEKWRNIRETNGQSTELEDSPWYGSLAGDLNWKQRVKMQAIAQQHIDHAISSTINLPRDATVEQVSEIYKEAWETGCKGITVYREGSRDGVIFQEETKEPEKRPKELDCDVHHIVVKGEQYFVLVGKKDDKPYEIFAGRNGFLNKKIETGKIIRKRKGFYKAVFDDEDDTELSPITLACSEHEEIITRLTSALLRSGANMHLVVQQLERVEGDMHSFSKATARALKKYIQDETLEGEKCPECKMELVRMEGCPTCRSCGYSRCN